MCFFVPQFVCVKNADTRHTVFCTVYMFVNLSVMTSVPTYPQTSPHITRMVFMGANKDLYLSTRPVYKVC